MANLTPTNLKVAQAKLTGKFASNEMRLISANTYFRDFKTYSVHVAKLLGTKN